MQSHASRHVISERLEDLHPDRSAPFPKGVIKDEIAVAYGRRGIQKLIDVLSLPDEELPDESKAHALHVLNGLLTTQEQKLDAISIGAVPTLTHLVESSLNAQVVKLSTEALGSLVQVSQGRKAVMTRGSLVALSEALKKTPEAAAGAIRRFVSSNEGVLLLMAEPSILGLLVAALVALSERGTSDDININSYVNAAAALASIGTTDGGIISSLENNVPSVVVALINRGLTGDLRFETKLNDLLEAGASCLSQCCHLPDGRRVVREAGGVDALSTILHVAQFSRPTLVASTSALMALSVEEPSKLPIMKNGGARLISLLKGEDEQLSGNARAALTSSCENLDARKIMALLLSEEDQKTVLFKGPLPPTPPDFRYKVLLAGPVGR